LDGKPFVRFDNAHAVPHRGGRFVKASKPYDHWHRSESERGRPYAFTTATQLLDDFWREVKRAMTERGIRKVMGFSPADTAAMRGKIFLGIVKSAH
jgi:hypothetical protein